ncbi:MAG: outer membrane protein transport protein [Kiritimatiellae bacterium]|nr:outer membrane protein transport protein [Kiritimatiellia bacterium]
MKKCFGLILAGTTLALASTGWGAGYGILEGSSRGNAMGTEVTADAVSPSVIYNNAAAMTELPGAQTEVGMTTIKPRQAIRTDLPTGSHYTDGESRWWTIPNAYMTYQVNNKIWAGMAFDTRIGLGDKFPNTWPGRYNLTRAEITSFEANPSVAWRVATNFSLAAGVRLAYFDFLLRKAVPTGTPYVDPDASIDISGDNLGLGYNAGAYWKALNWLSFGLSFNSRIRHDIDGEYELKGPTGQKITDGSASGSFPSPAEVRLGTSIKATERLKVNVGMTYTMWSCYDALTINFSPAVLGKTSQTRSEKNWHDTWRWQTGVEYALTDHIDVRAGYVYDKTPDPDYLVDYMVPANNRHIISFGGGWHNDSIFCDVGYTFLKIENREVHGHLQDGVWDGKFQDGDAHMVSASVGYKF